MTNQIKTVLFSAMVFFAAAMLGAQAFPALDPSPKAGEYARRIAQNDSRWRDLAEAALWASSVNAGPGAEEKAAAYISRIETAAADLAAADLPRDTKERGEYVLTYLHQYFLKSYSEHQSRIDEIIISGKYNCVSSAVLYMVLGLSVGLDVSGVMTHDHAFATVRIGTEYIDVETTTPYGYEPGVRKEFHDAFGKTTGFAYAPAKNYRDRAAISRMELVSLILSNRIADLERRNRFTEVIPLAINRAVFLSANPVTQGVTAPSATAQNVTNNPKTELFGDPRQDMMDRLFNVSADYIKAGKEDAAIAWAQYAEERFPDPGWQDVYKTAGNNKLVKLIKAKRTADARTALTALQPKLSNEHYRELETMVIDAEAVEKVNAIRNPGDAEAALAFLDQIGEQLPVSRRNDMRTKIIVDESERLRKTRNVREAIFWLESALQTYGANPTVEAALKTQRQNRIGELHNEFANLFNKRDYTGALASIQKSLQEFPGERMLLQDLDMAEKAVRGQ